MEFMTILQMIFRWIHFIFGVIWIGHLYFFNFVNGPFEKGLDASMKKPVVPALRGRALWWFRWGAMLTFLSGLALVAMLMHEEVRAGGNWIMNAKGDPATNNWWITLGALFGSVMWFNVWFVIWPRQQKLLTGIATGNKPTDFDQMVATATLASRVNTFLSVPLLFMMGARAHFPTGDALTTLVWMAIVTGAGFGVAWYFIFKLGGTVGKEFANLVAPAAPAPAAPAPK